MYVWYEKLYIVAHTITDVVGKQVLCYPIVDFVDYKNVMFL